MVKNLETFRTSLIEADPPKDLSLYLRALWYDGKGDWETAHNIAQDILDADGSWIHAYLHRKEGDGWNANYWYEKAGRSMSTKTLEEEWSELVEAFL